MEKRVIIYKKVGETPLEALENFRTKRLDEGHVEYRNIPMTYAGRLDPMAEGDLLILIGEECKKKDAYLGLDKEYEVEVLFGIETDTHDVLGIPKVCRQISNIQYPISKKKTEDFLHKYVGKFVQEYPAYSSKTVKGVQLHELARTNELPDPKGMPTKEVEIYSIEQIGASSIDAMSLKDIISSRISLVKGDFRQNEILNEWSRVLNSPMNFDKSFPIIKIKVKCSSGTYMRSLAKRIGEDCGTLAFALSIKRTRICMLE